jgi:adenylate kinase
MQTVIIVTGTPGTGKTTFAKALAKTIGANYVNITRYVSKHSLYRGVDRERRTRIIDVSKTRASLKRELGTMHGLSVVDTHIPEEIIPREMVKQVFVLRCHPRILEGRLRRRRWKANKIRENVLAEVVDSCLSAGVKYFGWRRVIQIDTSRRNTQDCVASAKMSILGEPTKRIKIDWISKLEREGLLDCYLK